MKGGYTMVLIISQIIGLAAVGLYLLSYQLKNRKQIVWTTFFSNFLYVVQYILLKAFSGAVMDALCAVGSFFAGKKHSPKLSPYIKWIATINLVVIAVAGVSIAIAQRDFIELLPVVGTLLQTGGLFCEDEQTIRKFGLIGAPFWLVYNFIAQAYGAAIGTVFIMVSAVTAVMRYRKKENPTDN